MINKSNVIDVTIDKDFNRVISGSRSREIFDIDTKLYFGNVVIYGEKGIGKTALLYAVRDLNTRGFERIDFRRGYEIEMDGDQLSHYLIDQRNRSDNPYSTLLIIDDFDQIRSPSILDKIARIMREGRKFGQRVLLASRQQLNYTLFEQNTETIFLERLGGVEVEKILDIYYRNSSDRKDIQAAVEKMIGGLSGNPREIIMALNFLLQHNGNKENHLVYKNNAIIEQIEKPSIIVNEAPKIITDLRVVNKRILDRIGRQPEGIYHLSPRQFEILVAELFEERGYKVQLTQQTRDGGKDLIILDHREVGNLMIYAECKQNSPDRPVGVSVVSDLVGRMAADRATAGLVVTSSYFSPDAKTFQSKFEHQMALIDFIKLSSMIKNEPSKTINK